MSWPVMNAAPGELSQSTALAIYLRSGDAANRGLCRNRFLHVGFAFTEGAVKHLGLDGTGSVHMESRKDVQQEFSELATEPDRWFAKLKSFVETEPDLDLARVYLGKD